MNHLANLKVKVMSPESNCPLMNAHGGGDGGGGSCRLEHVCLVMALDLAGGSCGSRGRCLQLADELGDGGFDLIRRCRFD